MIFLFCRRGASSILALSLIWVLAVGGPARGHDQELEGAPGDPETAEYVPCIDGLSGDHPCFNVDLVQFVPLSGLEIGDIRASRTNDIWGWTDPLTGLEYAILGLGNGTAFLHIEADGTPRFLGILPTRFLNSIWRDMKVYADHVFIVSEARTHGMQVFDLTRLRDLDRTEVPMIFDSDAQYDWFSSAHNIAINEQTGYAYAVGTNNCSGGLHMIDIRDPRQPTFAGCYEGDGYTHDAQCVIYHGPDQKYVGREICFNANEDTLTIVDVTDKGGPTQLSRTFYPGRRYAHQGWLTEDHAHFLLGDELDEQRVRLNTTTFVWDTSDLDTPFLAGKHVSGSTAIDHNQYVRGNHVFQANYRSGVRILRLGDLSTAEMAEVAFFDTQPLDDLPRFSGVWSVYPFFESGFIIASDIFRGLYILRPDLAAVPECSDGIDNDGDGLRDYPEDPTCIDNATASESIRFDVELQVERRFEVRPVRVPEHRNLKLMLLGSPTVDVMNLDFDSLLFRPGDVVPTIHEKRGMTQTRDVNRDGWPDVVLRIPLEPSTLAPGDEDVCITGLLSGDEFESCTEIEVDQHSRSR